MARAQLLILLALIGCSSTTPQRGQQPDWITAPVTGVSQASYAPSARILWLASHQDWEAALQLCEEGVLNETLDLHTLEQLGSLLLHDGLRGGREEQMLTLVGASIAQNKQVRDVLEAACSSSHPVVQIHALMALAQGGTDESDPLLMRALGSPWFPVRLTAAQLLAVKRSPAVIEQVEAMIHKLPREVRPYLAPLLGQVNTSDAISLLKRLAQDGQVVTRISAIHALAMARRDDEAPRLLAMVQQDQGAEAEACAWALGVLRDTRALAPLHRLLSSGEATTRIAALCSLLDLGDEEAIEQLQQEALSGNLYAITALGHYRRATPCLEQLSLSHHPIVRMIAALALLHHGSSGALPQVSRWLTADPQMMPLLPIYSPGRTLMTYMSRSPEPEEWPMALSIRQEVLQACLELPEADFLSLAERLYDKQQVDLIPLLTHLVENLQTPEAIQLLQRERQRAGAPVSRAYATLALYRMGEPGPWQEALEAWVNEHRQSELIRLQEATEWDPGSLDLPKHTLSPEQTSQLFIEVLETLAERANRKGRALVLRTIREGHPRNRFVLAGVLMRMAL